MGDDRTQPPSDDVQKAVDRRIRDEAVRLLEEIRPGDDDDWRLASLHPDRADPAGEPAPSGEGSEASSSARSDDSG